MYSMNKLVADLERVYRMRGRSTSTELTGAFMTAIATTDVPWPNREVSLRKAAAVLLPRFCLRTCGNDAKCLARAIDRVVTPGLLGGDSTFTAQQMLADDVTRAALFEVIAGHAQARAAAGDQLGWLPLKRTQVRTGQYLAQARLRGQGTFGNLNALPRELRNDIARLHRADNPNLP